MYFGSRDDFAIECYQDDLGYDWPETVFGRMCVWCRGIALGNVHGPVCILNVSEEYFQQLLGRLDDLRDEGLEAEPDPEAFRILDAALWTYHGQSPEQIYADAERFSKFNFLTGWGEPFDGTTAFLIGAEDGFRILYRLPGGRFGSGRVSVASLAGAVRGFLEWFRETKPRPRDARRDGGHA